MHASIHDNLRLHFTAYIQQLEYELKISINWLQKLRASILIILVEISEEETKEQYFFLINNCGVTRENVH